MADSPNAVHASRLALCQRAHNGLVGAKALLLVVDRERYENVLIPTEFWWAGGHGALEQNWGNGDFSTWIEKSEHWQAFGVEFDLDGILAMVPPERRGRVAREASVAGDAGWASAREAREIVQANGGFDKERAGRILIEHGQQGFIVARAVAMHRIEEHRLMSSDAREWDVPTWFWSGFTRPLVGLQRWDEGRFEGEGESPTGRCSIALVGLHISRDGLAAAFPPSAEPGQATQRLGAGGRPRAEYWDDLWCAVCGSIYRGELQPKTQADVGRWMLQWANDHGHDPGESTIRPRARRLFKELNEEGKNSIPE